MNRYKARKTKGADSTLNSAFCIPFKICQEADVYRCHIFQRLISVQQLVYRNKMTFIYGWIVACVQCETFL